MAVKNITVTRTWRGKAITAVCTRLDCGMHVLLTGGDRSHVGAVSMISPEKPEIITNTFPTHKEKFLTEPWATELCKQFHCPVTVAAGVHYDNVNKVEIAQIVTVCSEMLEELIYALKSR